MKSPIWGNCIKKETGLLNTVNPLLLLLLLLLLGFKLIEGKRLIKAQKSDSFTRRKHEMERKLELLFQIL